MFTFMLVLILLLPVALLPPALETLFSASELTEMGIRLEGSQSGDSVQTI
jgi:hypothetical protein